MYDLMIWRHSRRDSKLPTVSFLSYPNTCEQFFEKLRFTKTQSLDHSDYEGSLILRDLNEEVLENLQEQFDVIYDGGTLEHVFNFPISLANISRMLKTGGYAIHASPSSNHVDHGFYMFSPRALYEYYVANSWEIVESVILNTPRITHIEDGSSTTTNLE